MEIKTLTFPANQLHWGSGAEQDSRQLLTDTWRGVKSLPQPAAATARYSCCCRSEPGCWLPSCQHTHISNLLVCDGCRDLLHLHKSQAPVSCRDHTPSTHSATAVPILQEDTYVVPSSSALAAGSGGALVLCLLDGRLNGSLFLHRREECGIAVTQPRAVRPQTGCIGAVPTAIPYIHTTKASEASTASNTQAGRDAKTRKRHRCRIAPPLYTHGCGPCDHA
jgi:hypothetical protein